MTDVKTFEAQASETLLLPRYRAPGAVACITPGLSRTAEGRFRSAKRSVHQKAKSHADGWGNSSPPPPAMTAPSAAGRASFTARKGSVESK